jgi:hypothetical protein
MAYDKKQQVGVPSAHPLRFFVWVTLLCACGQEYRRTVAPTDASLPSFDSASPPQDAALLPSASFVYAHTASELYRINADTLDVTRVGAFGWPGISDDMTDVAVDREGNLFGVSIGNVYSIDPVTARCTTLTHYSLIGVNALSFLPPDQTTDPTGREHLVAADTGGKVYEINPKTGTATSIGAYGNNFGSSGDIVSVSGLGSFVTMSGRNTDWLGKVDPLTGKATAVGDTGVSGIYGLAFWKDQLFGFVLDGRILAINPKTAATRVVRTTGNSWFGAGVATSTPVIQ